ncbi:hypothetical protein K2173_021707 [Erythroxylum novogranatense]|uniref:glucan endo-1,3-beta-D-glucosidase n=1 Tax=Erythroxylum novogranatense TaxID=1862640 RepID=A0AAV8TIV0_9ROSI|nr:hypothetical protein K2173_021707 [Erythroxylum novogranatense]
MSRNMSHCVLFLLFLLVPSNAQNKNLIGVNLGRLGNNLPSAYRSIEILKSMNASLVKLYDADPELLKLLSGSKIRVSIMVPNREIINIASNQTLANNWVRKNVLTYYPETKIRFILVGNEVLSFYSEEDRRICPNIVPAMRKIKNSLKNHGIRNIKISTPVAMDVLKTPFPPSNGTFRTDISRSVIVPLLKFLNGTKSFFFVDVYPYFPWSGNPTNMSLAFALFKSSIRYTDPGSGLVYTNLLDQMIDSLIFAMKRLGYPNIRVGISETGWPHEGDLDQAGANIYNAASYNRNFINRMTTDYPIGTPARPREAIPSFIFSLFDENIKGGPGTERHWGLLYANATPVYDIDLTGKKLLSDYKPLPVPHRNVAYKGKLWCVVEKGADLTRLERALEFACNQGNGTCDALAPGKECYEPVSITWHASYAFSSYWARYRNEGANCFFDGLARQTTRNPSSGLCQFPSVTP